MLERTAFIQSVHDAYQHLYDIVYLRDHALTDIVVPDTSLRRKEKAWQVHHILLNVIDELDPGAQTPLSSKEWRRHQLMVLRYEDGLDPQAVADELGISRRHFYREHDAAIEAIASILWNRYRQQPQQAESTSSSTAPALDRIELLRMETARASVHHRAQTSEVLEGVVSLLRQLAHERDITIVSTITYVLPNVVVDSNLLRQMLIAILGHLIETSTHATLTLSAADSPAGVELAISLAPATAIQAGAADAPCAHLAALDELAALAQVRLALVRQGECLCGFTLHLPVGPQHTLLVVDDNLDFLALFRRILVPHPYRVITTQNAQEALALAQRVQPDVIVLDLMMPEQDGWDLLQQLRAQPETRAIPTVVCSVLQQQEVALSLGAAAFLVKPIDEEALLAVLSSLAL